MAQYQNPVDGYDTFRLLSAATVNNTLVKGARGKVFGIVVSNANAAARFVKLYDKTAAPVAFIQWMSTAPTIGNTVRPPAARNGRRWGRRRHATTLAVAAASAKRASSARTARGIRPQSAMNSRVAA